MSDAARYDEQELLRLIADVIDGELSEEGKTRLREILHGSAEARAFYRQHLDLHAQLHLDYDRGEVPVGMPELTPLPAPGTETKSAGHGFNWDWAFALGAAAVLVLFLNSVAVTFQSPEEGMLSKWESAENEAVAVITESVQADWSGKNWEAGAELSPGRVQLTAGVAQIEFFSGASVVLEGPASLELISADRAFLHHGKLRALVPEPAQGFVIETQDFKTVDLGTEFAMDVSDAGGEVHVLDGEVELHPNESGAWAVNPVTGGAGARVQGAAPEAIPLRPTEFVSREQLQLLAAGRGRERYESWQQSTQAIRERDDVVAFFSFEDHRTWDRMLRSDVGERNGAIVGARWMQGRWPGKSALEFGRISDRVRLEIPGEFEALTFSMWVRIDGLDQWLSSLMLTDGFDPGETHWQLSDSGELILGIAGAEPHNSFSPEVVSPRDLGRWLHLAVTADRQTGQVKHYLDGEKVSEHAVKMLEPLRIGPAEIGNWRSGQKQSHPLRSLNGTVDEFFILATALDEPTIQALYESGNPYR